MSITIKGKNGTISISGDITGDVSLGSLTAHGNVVINDDGVFVDGVKQDKFSIRSGLNLTVNVSGECISIDTTSGDVHVEGSVAEINTTSGDVQCGDVSGSVKTVSGDVTCGAIAGGVKTVSGDICKR